MTLADILSVLAVLGIGSIVVAFANWFVAISNHRQKWIDALREDLAAYLQTLDEVHYAVLDSHFGKDVLEKRRDAKLTLRLLYSRIVLRLNRTEPMHMELRDKLGKLMQVDQPVPNWIKIEEAVDLARQILKQEWDVAKYGVFRHLAVWIKNKLPRNDAEP